MNVLLTVHAFPPESRAGTELYTYYVARELKRSGVGVALLFAREGEREDVEHSVVDGLECTVVVKRLHGFLDLFREEDAGVDRVFRDCLERVHPDLVHVNHLLHLSTSIPRLAREHGVPVVFTLHDYWLRCPRTSLLDYRERVCRSATAMTCARCCADLYTRFVRHHPRPGLLGLADAVRSGAGHLLSLGLERLPATARLRERERRMRALQEYVDLWIAPSRFLQELMIEWGLPEERVSFLPHGLDRYASARPLTERRLDRLHFGYLGTISRQKGVHILLEAFRGLHGADLFIYGRRRPGFYRHFGDVLAQGNVHIMGAIDDASKAAAFASLDALIVPSIWFENAPLTIQEALVSGVPVLCSNIGGMREFVRDGSDGLHFRAGDARDFRRVLDACIHNPALLTALTPSGANIPTLREHVTQQLIPTYRRLVRGLGASPPPSGRPTPA